MIQYRKILELYFANIGQRTIASSAGSSRQTVSNVIKRSRELGLGQLGDEMTNQWLEEYLFPEKQAIEKGFYPVDWEQIHKELQKKNVTLALLHKEYADEAHEQHKHPYAYRTFAQKYSKYAKKYKLTMPIRRKPGEIMEVDWAGSTLSIQDRNTGEPITAYVFIATLPYSQMGYVEVFLDMKTESWLIAHIHAFEYFGGVAETLVPDNLKTGVIKSNNYEPVLNEAYRELADFYRTTIVPARVRTPKDKASVEGTVGFISRQIIAALRNYQCFNIRDLNNRVFEKVKKMNTDEFQKRPGSRKKVFDEEEKSHLLPLRQTRFKLSEWRTARVQLNYHVQVERMYYSVPYDFVRDEVSIRITKDLIEVYFKETRIASHKRLFGDVGQYSTNPDHMPDNHRMYLEHTPEKNLEWAEEIGEFTTRFVQYTLNSTVEKKALKTLMSLRNLARKYSPVELETASETLLNVAASPNLQTLKSILERNKQREKAKAGNRLTETSTDDDYGFTRGAKYFGGAEK
jgi:transposase